MNSAAVFFSRSLDIFRQAWNALSLHRLRSLLSTLGIVFAVSAVMTMLAIAEGAKKEALEQIGRLGIESIIVRGSEADIDSGTDPFGQPPEGLGLRDVNLLKRIPGIERITFIREFNALLAELGGADTTRTLEVKRDFFDVRGLRLDKGRFISDVDVLNRHQVCVLGGELAMRIGPGAGLGEVIDFEGNPHRIVGILEKRGTMNDEALPLALRDYDNAAFIPLQETSPSFSAMGAGHLSEIIINISDVSTMAAISGVVRHVLLWNRDGVENFELIIPRELLSQARQTQHLFNIVLGSIAGVSLLVGGIGIMNIMLANVSERTREIGIRRAIGASRRHIIAHFLGEAILLTIIGGILGIVLGSMAAFSVNVFVRWHASISLWPVLSALVMSVGVGIASGIYPAVKAANMDPVEALRHV